MRVLVLTTSYPRFAGDVAGIFVADSVEALRAAGVDVRVVSPADFPHYWIAYGHGIVQNLRARPWLVVLLPAFVVSFALAARRASRDVDVVHAHWLPSGLAALATGRPFVLQVWGTDVELARRAPWAVGWLVRRARAAIGASSFLAEQARTLGAREVRVIPSPVTIPESVGEPDEPPHVLFVGRLSEEKGILDFLEATEGLPRVIVGEGPLRSRVPEAHPFVQRSELGGYYERAAVVCVPSRREGYGMVAREAMAYGRPLVTTAVGGLVDAVVDGETGVAVAPRSPAKLREAVSGLLDDEPLRRKLGAAAAARSRAESSSETVAIALRAAYARAVEPGSVNTGERRD